MLIQIYKTKNFTYRRLSFYLNLPTSRDCYNAMGPEPTDCHINTYSMNLPTTRYNLQEKGVQETKEN